MALKRLEFTPESGNVDTYANGEWCWLNRVFVQANNHLGRTIDDDDDSGRKITF